MKDKKQPFGYTIVEVMIVLAVSGMMFVMAANFINGKQATVSFTQGANEMASRIQGTIDQVTDGRFSDVKLVCDVLGSDITVSTPLAGSPDRQGQNAKCVFMGKFIHFRVDNDKKKYETFLLAGKRASTTLSNAGIKAVYNDGDVTDLTVKSNVPQGLDIESVKVDGSAVHGLGFLRDPSDGVKVTAVYTTALGSNETQSSAASKLTSSNISLLSSRTAVVCVTDGNRYGTITIGEGAANLRIKTQLGLNSCP